MNSNQRLIDQIDIQLDEKLPGNRTCLEEVFDRDTY